MGEAELTEIAPVDVLEDLHNFLLGDLFEIDQGSVNICHSSPRTWLSNLCGTL